jgi:hypothetical protein
MVLNDIKAPNKRFHAVNHTHLTVITIVEVAKKAPENARLRGPSTPFQEAAPREIMKDSQLELATLGSSSNVTAPRARSDSVDNDSNLNATVSRLID